MHMTPMEIRIIDWSSAGCSSDLARIVPPGRRAVLYINAPIPAAAPPASISHRLTLGKIGGDDARFTLSGGAALPDTALPRLSPPLPGGPWVAGYSPGMEAGHRPVLYAPQGQREGGV